jgi:hypothetical protein
VYFEYENVDAAVADLRQQGIVIEEEPKDQPWLWREADLRDPDGNSLCLFTPGRNRKYPPLRVDVRCPPPNGLNREPLVSLFGATLTPVSMLDSLKLDGTTRSGGRQRRRASTPSLRLTSRTA